MKQNSDDSISGIIQEMFKTYLPIPFFTILEQQSDVKEYILQLLVSYVQDENENDDDTIEGIQETICTLLMGYWMTQEEDDDDDDNMKKRTMIDDEKKDELNSIVHTILMSINQQLKQQRTTSSSNSCRISPKNDDNPKVRISSSSFSSDNNNNNNNDLHRDSQHPFFNHDDNNNNNNTNQPPLQQQKDHHNCHNHLPQKQKTNDSNSLLSSSCSSTNNSKTKQKSDTTTRSNNNKCCTSTTASSKTISKTAIRRQQRIDKQQQQQKQKKQLHPRSSSSTKTNSTTTDVQQEVDTTTTTEDSTTKNTTDTTATTTSSSSTITSWGGRGRGGRGIRSVKHYSSQSTNIHLTNVSLLMENGNQLLHETIMDIQKGRIYGLIGRNGVGKSTLLRQLASYGTIPGLPMNLRVLYVEQQVLYDDDDGNKKKNDDDDNDNDNDTNTQRKKKVTTLQTLMNADILRNELLQEQMDIEQQMDDENMNHDNNNDTTNITQLANRLNEISIELDAIHADAIEERAIEILRGLQFTKRMIEEPASNLSGGWRMRLAIARALIQIDSIDLLLLDECTNHLDLHGMDWLINYFTSNNKKNNNKSRDYSLIVVSHDRAFLDAVCTDIIVMEHKQLQYHVGNYSEYERQKQEKIARQTQIVDAAERQRTKAIAFVQKQQQQASSSTDPNKQRQAKMIKEKKMDRIGNYREDGKRYKNYSLKKLDESYLRIAQKVQIEMDDAIIPMYFPNPTWPPSIANSSSPILRLDNLCFAYQVPSRSKASSSSSPPYLLNNITISLNRESKVALVGKNGTGKSTLCKLICGMLTSSNLQAEYKQKGYILHGELWSHPNLRVGYVTQYSVEDLEQRYGNQTILEYAELIGLTTAKASASIISKASGNIRQYLGAFGLGSTRHVTSPIRHLSGGERMRLCFASVLANEPHLLLLDESTNHVDIETQESMSNALKKFQGAVIMVSHNQAFLSGFCEELWALDTSGYLMVNHSDTKSFDEIFLQYRCHELNQNSTSLTSRRQEKAHLAKKSMGQKPTTFQGTGLL